MSEVQPVAEATPAPVTIVETPTPSIEDTMAEVYEKNYPNSRVDRAPTGEFKSKEAAAEVAPEEVKADGAEVVGDGAEIVTDEVPTAEPKETAKPSIPRPQALSSDVDELWSKLPPAAQELWAKRESETHKKISELGQAVKATEQVRPHLEQLEKIASARGIHSGEAIQRFLAADEFLARDPFAAIQWLAQSYRIDLSRLGGPQIGGDVPESVSALTQEINQLKQQLYGVTNQITAREQSERQAREQSLTQSIEKFAEGKPYWSDTESEVLAQVHALKLANAAADPMEILQQAYDRAVKLTPSVQEKLEKSAKEEAAKKAAAETKKKADEAKRQASLNVKSTSGSSPNSSSKDMYSGMAEIYDKIVARG